MQYRTRIRGEEVLSGRDLRLEPGKESGSHWGMSGDKREEWRETEPIRISEEDLTIIFIVDGFGRSIEGWLERSENNWVV